MIRRITFALLLFLSGAGAAYLYLAATGKVMRREFRTRSELVLADGQGHTVCRLPKGTLLLAERSLSDPDAGWWGAVPILFGTDNEAAPWIEPEPRGRRSFGDRVLQLHHAATKELTARPSRPAPRAP
ncbi:MAG TPA: hypothetical protein VF618_02885 [Thermoanaerobaculia bacterium]